MWRDGLVEGHTRMLFFEIALGVAAGKFLYDLMKALTF
jgi:hypothetical protein